jgi:hypothetical protein
MQQQQQQQPKVTRVHVQERTMAMRVLPVETAYVVLSWRFFRLDVSLSTKTILLFIILQEHRLFCGTAAIAAVMRAGAPGGRGVVVVVSAVGSSTTTTSLY